MQDLIRRFRNYTHRGRIAVTEGHSETTGKDGVVIFSEDARAYWFLDDPEQVMKFAKALEEKATALLQKNKGQTFVFGNKTNIEVLSIRQYPDESTLYPH